MQHAHSVRARCLKRRREAESDREGAGDVGHGAGKAPAGGDAARKEVGQFFTSGESCEIILKEMCSGVIEASNEGMWFADSIDDDLGRWLVKLYFSPDSPAEAPLSDALQRVARQHAYGYVEIQLSFQTDLYPFCPPAVRLVRPRFRGYVMERVAALPGLLLQNWNPTTAISKLLGDIKAFLVRHGEVDAGHPLNSPGDFPAGAYTGIEYALSTLATVTNTIPLVALQHPEWDWQKSDGIKNLAARKEGGGAAGEGKEYWAKGTGYGTGDDAKGGPTWDVVQYEAVQQRMMEKTDAVLLKLLGSLVAGDLPEDLSDLEVDEVVELEPAVVSKITDSALAPFAAQLMQSSSIIEMVKRPATYAAFFKLLGCVGANERLAHLFGELRGMPEAAPSLRHVLRPLSKSASTFLAQYKKVAVSDGATDKEQKLIQSVLDVYQAVGEAANAPAPPGQGRNGGGGAGSSRAEDPDPAAEYVAKMKAFQFDGHPLAEKNVAFRHLYLDSVEKSHHNSGLVKERMTRLASDAASLQDSLPVSLSSTVFLRVDDGRPDLMRAMITGPEDTPYECGCFVFDIGFPSSYPNDPPKVRLQTTGRGSVRFNPNLYANGKVCLSLLGTWSGAKGEQWDRNSSTLLQVLVSIQSLILVPDPYFNEPGYERSMNEHKGKVLSFMYNANIRVQCVKWAMLEALGNPPGGFNEAIETHFRLRKAAVLDVCGKWLKELEEPPLDVGAGNRSQLNHYAAQLKEHIASLRETLAAL